MTKNDIKRSIDNSIRSLFEMIAVVNDASGKCSMFDQSATLAVDYQDGACDFSSLIKSLIKNVHPEDREAFEEFTDHDRYVGALREHVHLSMECRIRHTDRRYRWSEIIICNTTAADSTRGDDCLFMIRDIDERKKRELKILAEERAVLKILQSQYDALFEENMTDQQTGCYNRKGLKYLNDTFGLCQKL